MIKFLTIFNLLAGAASIIGLYVSLNLGNVGYALLIVFSVTLVLSLYVLFVPGSQIEENVRAKITRYISPKQTEDSSDLVIQRGEFRILQWGPAAVEFYEPFIEPPEVEVINDRGYGGTPPIVESITAHQAVFRRNTISAPGQSQTFSWVARGTSLKRKV